MFKPSDVIDQIASDDDNGEDEILKRYNPTTGKKKKSANYYGANSRGK